MSFKTLLNGLGLTLLLIGQTLHAQQSEVDRQRLTDLRRKAERGDAFAQCALGEVFHFGKLGVKKDDVESAKWFRKAAQQNFGEAEYNLGICFAKGQGVAKNDVESVQWFRKAAEKGIAGAQYSLGMCYDFGRGVMTNELEAVKWYRKAAEQDFLEAQYNLGNCFAKGTGVLKDDAEAVKWFKIAAERNLAIAQYNLGVCYGKGEGVAKDELEGYKWITLAAAQEFEQAKNAESMLKDVMSPEHVAEGRRRAYDWLKERKKLRICE